MKPHTSSAPLCLTRRHLLLSGTGAVIGAMQTSRAAAAESLMQTAAPPHVLRLGVISDLHQDVVDDAMERLQGFLSASRGAEVDAVIQLGDFAQPKQANEPILKLWRELDLPHHSVLGNHDMDGGKTRDDAVKAFGMPGRYYAVELKGVKLIVLDGNEPSAGVSGYARSLGGEQLDWLRAELGKDRKPVLVCVHQPPLELENCLVDGDELLQILEEANRAAGRRVIALLCGHLHRDFLIEKRGIPCLQINSAAYFWADAPYIYEGPLWAIIDIDLRAGTVEVKGTATRWEGSSPEDDGRTVGETEQAPMTTRVSARQF